MARPQRNNVDYFPFICKEGKGMYYIENKYGNDGYAVWVKILRELAVTDYHYLDLSNRIKRMYLSSKCKVSEDVLQSIIDDLCELDEFDKKLWKKSKIVWSEKFIEGVKEAYKKRSNHCVDKKSLLTLLISLGILKQGKGIPKRGLGGQSTSVKPQSKVKESKEKEDFVFQKVEEEEEEFFKKVEGFSKRLADRSEMIFREAFYRSYGLKKDSLSLLVDEFKIHLQKQIPEHPKNYNFKEFKKHLDNWARIKNSSGGLVKYQRLKKQKNDL